MAGKMENIANLFSNMRTRTIILLTAGILGFALLVGIIRLYKASESNSDTSSAGLVTPPRQESIPGLAPTSARYGDMQKELSKQRIQEAQKTGGSAIPTVVYKGTGADGFGNADGSSSAQQNPGVQGNPLTGLSGFSGNGTVTPGTGAFSNAASFPGGGDGTQGNANAQTVTPQQLQQMQAQLAQQQAQLAQLADQQNQQNRQATVASMQGQVQALLNSWNSSPNQQYQEGVLANANAAQGQGGQGTAGGAGADQNNATNAGTGISQAPIMKAGDIIYAVLNTELNSDEPGPIMATVVSGPYKGAKLIGSMRQTRDIPGTNGPTAVTLNFTTINLPSEANSIGINAVAIDPDTARTALASDVDHHYLLRYGSLFGSSFLEGYGTAIGRAGTTVTQNSDGSVFATYPELSPAEEVAVGIGQVGQEWGNQLGDTFNRQNTIVVHSGTGMGILFLSDVQLGSSTTNAQQTTTVLPSATVSSASSDGTGPFTGIRL